ncbi:MAG: DegT/DnrJ/EryC1/StrS aminotransferase family protein [Deltaproteobacteria bacterium]|nr:DegT/DnrJ/EryC1/StrS aminotransferase family protein [Deltaproteobacteria bacterium]
MIPVFKPSYGQEEKDAISRVLDSGWTGLGPETEKFEQEFADYLGVKHAIGLSSGTAALQLAVEYLVPRKSLVITTPLTFVSTAHAIRYNDCQVYFADIEPDTLNIDLSSVPVDILKVAAAVVIVHFAGYACDMAKIYKYATEYDLKIIEDVAHGCGGVHELGKLGTLGDAGCFSFHAVKNLSCGDGGMLTTNDGEFDQWARRMRWLGIDKSTWDRQNIDKYEWNYDVVHLGYKCHMNDITAAIGRVQLEKLEKANENRRVLAGRYTQAFHSGHAAIQDAVQPLSVNHPEVISARHAYVIKCENRDGLHEYLKKRGVASSVHYMPLFYFSQYAEADCPVAREVWKEILTLPLYPDMTNEEQDQVIGAVKEFYGKDGNDGNDE